MSPLVVEKCLVYAQSLSRRRFGHMLYTASYQDSTFNDDIAKENAYCTSLYLNPASHKRGQKNHAEPARQVSIRFSHNEAVEKPQVIFLNEKNT